MEAMNVKYARKPRTNIITLNIINIVRKFLKRIAKILTSIGVRNNIVIDV